MLRRAGVVLAALLVATLPAFAQSPTPAPPQLPQYDFYSMEASAGGFRTFMSIKGYLPVDPLIDAALPDAHTIVDTGRKIASASLPYPGETVLSVPGTAAGLGGIPNLPGYPLAVFAQDPSTPAQKLDAGVTRLQAEADPVHAAALAAAEDQHGPPASGGSVFTIGTVRAETISRQLDATTLEATATSALRDISLLGGQLRIGAIVSKVTSAIAAGKPTVQAPTVELSGATFAGQAVAIDGQGVHLGTTSAPLPGADAALRDALKSQGVSIFTTRPERTVTANEGSARGAALVVRMTGTFQNNPVVITYSLGDARVAVKASGQRAPVLQLPLPTGTPPSVAAPPEFPPLPAAAAPLASATSDIPTPAAAPVSAAPRVTTARRGRTSTRLVGASGEFDLVGIYRGLALLGAVALVFALLARRVLQRRTARAAGDDLRGLWRW